MLIVQFLIPGTVPFQCSSNSPLSALRFHHFLSLIFISSWNKYIRRAHFFQRYWQGVAPIVGGAFSFGREARVPRSSAWETTAALSFLSFFYRARRRSRGKWEPLAATCDTWSFPRCSTAARPRTRVSGHVFHTVT